MNTLLRHGLLAGLCMIATWSWAGQATAQARAGQPVGIDYYGDSTIWGYGTGTGKRVARPAPAVFAEALAGAPVRFTVRNEGVNGSTACDLLKGADTVHPPWPAQMATSDARYVIVNFGINDQWKQDAATYQSCLRDLARGAKARGKQVFFETPNPTRDSGSRGLDVYVDAMREVAQQEHIPVIDQYRFLNEYLAGRSPYAICPDGLHPSDPVYEMKGRYAADAFMQWYVHAVRK